MIFYSSLRACWQISRGQPRTFVLFYTLDFFPGVRFIKIPDLSSVTVNWQPLKWCLNQQILSNPYKYWFLISYFFRMSRFDWFLKAWCNNYYSNELYMHYFSKGTRIGSAVFCRPSESNMSAAQRGYQICKSNQIGFVSWCLFTVS